MHIHNGPNHLLHFEINIAKYGKAASMQVKTTYAEPDPRKE